MFDKISRAAERAAVGVGRREFLGRLGRGAAALAAGLGGVVLSATGAHAAPRHCCFIWDKDNTNAYCVSGRCKPNGPGYATVLCADNPGACPQG